MSYRTQNVNTDEMVREAEVRMYEAKAKYYLDLQMMSSSRTSIRGTQVIYSSFSSSRFASTVYNEIIEGTSLVSTGSGKNKGILEYEMQKLSILL